MEISCEDGPSYRGSLSVGEEGCPNLNEVLGSLAERGALRKSDVGSVPSSPNCGSFKLMLRFTCPARDSINVRRTEAVAHLSCGFVAPAEEFAAGDSLRCPGRGKVLRAMGVDRSRLNGVILCGGCGKIPLSPELALDRAERKTGSGERGLLLKPVYRYEVLREKPLVRRPILDETVRDLRDLGLEVISPRVAGPSGMVHRSPIRRGGKWAPDRVRGEGPVSEDKVLSVRWLTHANESTLVAVPRASEGAEALAKSFNINLVEASSPEEVASKILECPRGRPSGGVKRPSDPYLQLQRSRDNHLPSGGGCVAPPDLRFPCSSTSHPGVGSIG